MATIRSALVLNDGMSSVLKKINKAMGTVLDSFDAVQQASGQTFNTANIAAARQEIGQANAAIEEMEQNYRAANTQQTRLNRNITEGTTAAGGLLGKIKALAAAYLGMRAVNWVKDSMELYDTQKNAETQLKTVLKNMGAVGDAYDMLTKKASTLQKTTAYGDEALLGGAAEFATYMSDPEAIAKMMDTLANYAAGMSGGGEVGYKEMVDYATGLGKIVNGSYDAMTKKGFTFTDQQKKIIENGTDMEKALVISDVVNESWANLATQMANTPQGKIIALKNVFGDMREELAQRVYPYVMRLFDTISKHSSGIKDFIVGLEKPIKFVLNACTLLVQVFAKMAKRLKQLNAFLRDHKEYIYAIAAVIAAYYLPTLAAAVAKAWEMAAAWLAANWQFALFAAAAIAITAILSALGVSLEWIAIAIMLVVIAYAAWQIAQWALNGALYACPIVWILAIVIALLVILFILFKMFTQEIMGAIFWLGALFKNVGLWIANLAIAIWNSIKNIGLWFANLGLAIWQVIKNVGLWFANLGLAIWAVIKNIGMWFANLGASVWAIIKNTGLWFANLGMGIWNVLKAAASNVGTAFHNAWISVQIGFWSMVNVIMQGLKKLAEFANSVLGWMGVNIDTSGLDFAANKIDELASKKDSYESVADAWAEGFNTFAYDSVSDAWNSHGYDSVSDAFHTNEYGSVSDAFNTNDIDWAGGWNEGMNTFDTFQEGWGTDAYNAGAAVGADIQNWMDENLSLDGIMNGLGLGDLMGGDSIDPMGYGDTLDGIADDTGSIADATGKSSEELSYLRDIAEKEAVNRFTTAEIRVDMSGMTNRIDSDMDIDGVIGYLTGELEEALLTAAEGVH